MLQGGLPALGHVLHSMARSLIGKRVMRNWPDNGGWWEAHVVGYGPTSGQHKYAAPCPHAQPGLYSATVQL